VNVECAGLHADALPSASVVAAFGLETHPPLQPAQRRRPPGRPGRPHHRLLTPPLVLRPLVWVPPCSYSGSYPGRAQAGCQSTTGRPPQSSGEDDDAADPRSSDARLAIDHPRNACAAAVGGPHGVTHEGNWESTNTV